VSALLREELHAAMRRPLNERLIITPLLDEQQVGPSSIDLRLGTQFIQVRRHAERAIDPFDETSIEGREEGVSIPFGGQFVLHPGQFVLGATLEFLRLPNDLAGQVLGRSSWGRLGLVVATAVTVQAGYAGCLTLELVNMGSVPLLLRPGLRVAQLCLWKSEMGTAVGYQQGAAKYLAPLGPQSSRLGVEGDELKRLDRIARHLAGESLSEPIASDALAAEDGAAAPPAGGSPAEPAS
jgi:dCTP deaminase